MGLFSNLKNWFSTNLKRKGNDKLEFLEKGKKVEQLSVVKEVHEYIELPEEEIVSFSDEVLDTTSKVSEEKFKHNLEVLMKKAKETGKIDKFMLIREENFFPTDWEWRVLSKDTNLEMESTSLSYELRKAYALEQNGIDSYIEVNGMKVPRVSHEQTMEALSKVDRTFGNILLPSRFRSTKHFTINTPLGVTGDYNSVSTNRDYIIIDNIDGFLKSKYGYSVSYHDAYLDISHESLPISEKAVVLINDENYDRIMSDEKVANELAKRKVVRFKGDEIIATAMILTEMGILPSKVGTLYANYDEEIYDILDNSIKNLAEKNGLFFDKSHGGELKSDGGHFSNYYDEKNKDYEKAIEEFFAFLRKKFPEQSEIFPEYSEITERQARDIVEKIGTSNLSTAINEYNKIVSYRLNKRLEEYKQDRKNITPEIHKQFTQTIHMINEFYKTDTNYESYDKRVQIEEIIQRFIQEETVEEQLQAAESIRELLQSKNINKTETVTNPKPELKPETINMKQVISNAITKGTSIENLTDNHNFEKHIEGTKGQNNGEVK